MGDWFFGAAERLELVDPAFAEFNAADEISRQGGDIHAVDPDGANRDNSHVGALLGLVQVPNERLS